MGSQFSLQEKSKLSLDLSPEIFNVKLVNIFYQSSNCTNYTTIKNIFPLIKILPHSVPRECKIYIY
jgi:hypothetical protein